MASDTKTLALEAKKRGNQFYKAKNWEQAIACYTEAIELDDTNHTFFSNRSACFAGKEDYENSLKDAEEVIRIDPKFAKGYTRKALALRKLERNDEAVACYRKGLDECGKNQSLAQGLQSAMQASGRGMIPREVLNRALMSDPEVANWYATDEEFKRRVDTLTMGFPDSKEFATWIADPKIKKFFSYAGLNFGAGETKAGEPFEEFKPAAPKREPTPEPELTPEELAKKERTDAADALKVQGTAEYKKKNFEEALRLYSEAAELCPESPVFMLNQAAVKFMMADLEGCEELCRNAIKVSREHMCDSSWDAKAYARLASIEERRQNYEGAIELINESLLENNNPKVRGRLKKLRSRKKKKAAKDLLDPEEALEYKNRGDDAFRSGKWKEAINLYAEAIKRNPNDEKVYNNRSTALCKVMGWQEALEDAVKAIALKPNWVKPYLRKCRIEQALQKYHRALQTLKTAKKCIENPADVDMEHMKLRMAISKANATRDPARQQRALEDPEIQRILKDPVISGLLKSAETDPSQIQKAMKNDQHVAECIDMLAAAGIIM